MGRNLKEWVYVVKASTEHWKWVEHNTNSKQFDKNIYSNATHQSQGCLSNYTARALFGTDARLAYFYAYFTLMSPELLPYTCTWDYFPPTPPLENGQVLEISLMPYNTCVRILYMVQSSFPFIIFTTVTDFPIFGIRTQLHSLWFALMS